MPGIPLEGQVQAYWLLCRDLRLIRDGDVAEFMVIHDGESIEKLEAETLEEIADLGAFTDHPRLQSACLSHFRCGVLGATA